MSKKAETRGVGPRAILSATLLASVISLVATAAASLQGRLPQLRSTYAELNRPRTVSKPTTLVRTTIRLSQPEAVYVQSDGTYRPRSLTSAADL